MARPLSQESLTIISVGAALFVGLGSLMLALHAQTNARISSLEQRMTALEQRVTTLEVGQARIIGLLEGSGVIRPQPATAGKQGK